MYEIELAIKQGYRYALVNGLLDDKPTSVSLKNSFDTACWSFVKGKHEIYVGDGILKRVKQKVEDVVYYIQSYLFHEFSHSCHTEKNLSSVSEWCNKNKVPFQLLNLFEDARIEHLWRETTERKFKWLDWEELELKADEKPTGILFAIIQSELEYEITSLPKGDRVMEYYNRIISCDTTIELYPILLEWMEEFPETQQEIEEMKQKGQLGDGETGGDLELSEAMQSDVKVAEAMAQDTKNVAGVAPAPAEKKEEKEKEMVEFSTTSHGEIYREGFGGSFDKKLVEKYLPQFEKLFVDKKKMVASQSPSKKLNIRAIAVGKTDKLYRKEQSTEAGNKVVNLIVDCSGSMHGSPIKDARTLVFLINSLALKNRVSGNLVLTGANGRTGQTMTFKLPVSEAIIGNIVADGSAENIKGTIEKIKPLMKKVDWNFVFTDGRITDGEIDKKVLNRQGVYTFGMYSGKESNLEKWFDKNIARETMKELMDELVRKLK